VWQVLEQIASGMAWESIIEEWEGSLTTEAIAEAVKLYRDLDFLLESRCQRMGHRING
ncbi:MAG: hypothetical protein HW378_1713, partial [Anaerolineales bacterium]|nr:hypothetical protein [Anaerolineales bacterium]